MSSAIASPGNLLINGAFLDGLWERLDDPETSTLTCPVDARTFAADRWGIRYAAPLGGPVTQARSLKLPPATNADTSLEIRGGEGVMQSVLVGQTIEAAEAPGYRRPLRFVVWCLVEHSTLRECPIRLRISAATTRDVFDSTAKVVFERAVQSVPVHVWTRLEFAFDATDFSRLGICVELEIAPAFLNSSTARVRLTDAALWADSDRAPGPRPTAIETLLARRFFQKHSARSINAIGPALVCNPHELHFQFTFPEMRAVPVIALPQDNDDLCVCAPDGVRLSGFVYDVPHAARGSAIIRATKFGHGLRDGYLAFRGYRGAILLEAEL